MKAYLTRAALAGALVDPAPEDHAVSCAYRADPALDRLTGCTCDARHVATALANRAFDTLLADLPRGRP